MMPITPMKRLIRPARIAFSEISSVARPVAIDAASDRPATTVVESRSRSSACLLVFTVPATNWSAACAWRNWNQIEQIANRIGPATARMRVTAGSSSRRARVTQKR